MHTVRMLYDLLLCSHTIYSATESLLYLEKHNKLATSKANKNTVYVIDYDHEGLVPAGLRV